jgi:hypothetical protein
LSSWTLGILGETPANGRLGTCYRTWETGGNHDFAFLRHARERKRVSAPRWRPVLVFATQMPTRYLAGAGSTVEMSARVDGSWQS